MPHVSPLVPDAAPAASRTVYDEFHRIMQFPAPPNFILTQGHSPTVARGTWELVRNVLVHGQIPRWMKEVMFVAISNDRNCRYCTAAHIACCRMLGVDPQTIESMVRDITKIPDAKLRDMTVFAIKCSRNPQGLTEGDFQPLRDHGFHESEIMEVIAMSALAVYANIVADATAMQADAMFETL